MYYIVSDVFNNQITVFEFWVFVVATTTTSLASNSFLLSITQERLFPWYRMLRKLAPTVFLPPLMALLVVEFFARYSATVAY